MPCISFTLTFFDSCAQFEDGLTWLEWSMNIGGMMVKVETEVRGEKPVEILRLNYFTWKLLSLEFVCRTDGGTIS
jgi:hypothetical protein